MLHPAKWSVQNFNAHIEHAKAHETAGHCDLGMTGKFMSPGWGVGVRAGEGDGRAALEGVALDGMGGAGEASRCLLLPTPGSVGRLVGACPPCPLALASAAYAPN